MKLGFSFLKTKLHLCFPLFSLLEPLIQRKLDASFLGRLWRHKRFWITWRKWWSGPLRVVVKTAKVKTAKQHKWIWSTEKNLRWMLRHYQGLRASDSITLTFQQSGVSDVQWNEGRGKGTPSHCRKGKGAWKDYESPTFSRKFQINFIWSHEKVWNRVKSII